MQNELFELDELYLGQAVEYEGDVGIITGFNKDGTVVHARFLGTPDDRSKDIAPSKLTVLSEGHLSGEHSQAEHEDYLWDRGSFRRVWRDSRAVFVDSPDDLREGDTFDPYIFEVDDHVYHEHLGLFGTIKRTHRMPYGELSRHEHCVLVLFDQLSGDFPVWVLIGDIRHVDEVDLTAPVVEGDLSEAPEDEEFDGLSGARRMIKALREELAHVNEVVRTLRKNNSELVDQINNNARLRHLDEVIQEKDAAIKMMNETRVQALDDLADANQRVKEAEQALREARAALDVVTDDRPQATTLMQDLSDVAAADAEFTMHLRLGWQALNVTVSADCKTRVITLMHPGADDDGGAGEPVLPEPPEPGEPPEFAPLPMVNDLFPAGALTVDFVRETLEDPDAQQVAREADALLMADDPVAEAAANGSRFAQALRDSRVSAKELKKIGDEEVIDRVWRQRAQSGAWRLALAGGCRELGRCV